MATHVPAEVPLWLCPQLTFYTYPPSLSKADLNAMLRADRPVPHRRRVPISRPERPGDGVRYDGGAASPDSEERLSRLFGGALGAAVDDVTAVGRSQASAQGAGSGGRAPGRGGAQRRTMTVAPAWGIVADAHLGDDAGSSTLAQPDGVGGGLEEVEEDWLKA